MDSQNERREISHIETEPHPKVLISFYGLHHDELNLQVIDDIRHQISQHFRESPGRKVIFLESAAISRSDADRAYKGFRKEGLLRHYLRHSIWTDELGVEPSDNQIEKRIQLISDSDLPTILDKQLIPRSFFILNYYLYQELDNLKRDLNFDIQFESHSKESLKKIQTVQTEFTELNNKSHLNWQNGNFDQAIEYHKEFYKKILQGGVLREEEVVDDLKSLARKLLKEKNGGSIFIIFGNAHSIVTDILKRKLGPTSPVTTNYIDHSPTASEIEIAKNLRNKENISDVMYARNLFEGTTFWLIKKLQWPKNTTQFASNFETILKTVNEVANSLSLEEIREICEKRVNLLELLRNHRLASPIQQFISPNP